MEQLISIKNKVIGTGKPLVCISIMEKTKEEVVAKAKLLVERSVEMIEWRVDAFEKVENLNALREVLEELKPIVEKTIFVFTFRSQKQGGLLNLSDDQIYDIHQVAAETKVADFVDVELFASKKAAKEIRTLQNMGVRVIASHHDFDETPKREVIRMLLEQMKDSGADVVKLAVMPQSAKDVLRLLEETNDFHVKYPDCPLITMSMGGTGCISRVAGEVFGSCVTFASFEQASAPGQLPIEQLNMMLAVLHQNMEG